MPSDRIIASTAPRSPLARHASASLRMRSRSAAGKLRRRRGETLSTAAPLAARFCSAGDLAVSELELGFGTVVFPVLPIGPYITRKDCLTCYWHTGGPLRISAALPSLAHRCTVRAHNPMVSQATWKPAPFASASATSSITRARSPGSCRLPCPPKALGLFFGE
jgi:hypothetical protein